MGDSVSTKIDFKYAEKSVFFSFCDCSLDKKYSFWSLEKVKAKELRDRLGHIEKMIWKQLASLGRKDGLTTEIRGTKSFNMIEAQDSSGQKIVGEQYYFHFRVEKIDKFRVFGYQKGQLFCITHIDHNGNMHEH